LGITTDEGLVLASDSRTNAGFDQHMIKPVDPEELEAFLSNYRP